MLNVEGRQGMDSLILMVSGRIDAAIAEEFEQRANVLIETFPAKNLKLDLAGLEYISSSGLREILKLMKKFDKLEIVNSTEEVYHIFDITGFTELINIEAPTARSDAPEVKEGSLNDTAWNFEFKPAADMFEEQVRQNPEKLAVVTSQVSFTYEELNEFSNRIANMLRFYNVRPDDTVMILLPRNVMVYAANLGVLKAGAAFVIANLGYPDDRISFMYKDAGCRFLITTHHIAFERLDLILEIGQKPMFLENIISSPWPENPNVRIDERDLAYCIYTSGSTGNPKGVMIENGNLSNFLNHNPRNYETMGSVERGSVELAMAPTTFDVSIMEEFIPLTSGMTVAMVTEEEIMNPLKMKDFILEHKVDVMCSTPSYLNSLLSLPQLNEAIAQIKVFDIGAEAFPGSLYEKIRAVNPDAYIMNGYGPTETTISCTMKVLDGGDNITIGIPNSNVFCYIVDDQLNEVPKGEIGELLVCGKGVGRGYKNLPEKTAAVFVEFRGMRAYRTGDLARINENDEIEFHGRNDSQIKLHGLRIELGEIEENMQKFEKIDACAAVPIDNRYLCLYYTPAGDVSKEEVREFAKGHLAHYMVPDLYEQIDHMPLTANCKIDRKALPKPELPKVELLQPQTPMQERMLEIIRSVLAGVEIGADSNLHDLGMSSLDVIVLLGALGDEYDVALNINDINDNATVIALEKMILSKPKIKKREKKEFYPLIGLQPVTYLEWVRENTPVQTMPLLLALDLSVDNERLIKAINSAIAAHPGVNCLIRMDSDGTLSQYFTGNKEYTPEIIKVSEAQMEGIKESLAKELMEREAERYYEMRIYETEERKYLFMRFAHVISDGDSVSLLIDDIAKAYDGKSIQNEAMTIFDRADEIVELTESHMYLQTLSYYRKLFKGLDSWMKLPEDVHEEPLKLTTYTRKLDLPKEEIQSFAKSLRSSEGNFFQAIAGLCFAVLSGGALSSFMMVYNGRSDYRLLNTFGYLAIELPVICKVDGEQEVSEYVRQIQSQEIESMGHEVFPTTEMMQKYPDMFNYLFIYQGEDKDVVMDGKTVDVTWLSDNIGNGLIRLALQVFDAGDSYQIAMDYHANRYSREWIEKVADMVEKFARQALKVTKLKDILQM